jgi:hypothetical protein
MERKGEIREWAIWAARGEYIDMGFSVLGIAT